MTHVNEEAESERQSVSRKRANARSFISVFLFRRRVTNVRVSDADHNCLVGERSKRYWWAVPDRKLTPIAELFVLNGGCYWQPMQVSCFEE